jgi:hypothetical protein
MTPAQEAAAQACLTECLKHIAAGEHESAIRSVFNSHLRAIAGSPLPWWAEEHFVRTEAALRIGRTAPGFADNVVGLTAIEYEQNLTVSSQHATGLGQVHDYIAGLLNTGAPVTSVRGVLSDTIRWEAFEVKSVSPSATVGSISRSDLTLRRVDRADCAAATLTDARRLYQFLEQQLGRDGGQVLTAETLHTMFGVTSQAGAGFVANAKVVVDAAFAANPGYAGMVKHLWSNFVTFVGTTTAGVFDQQAYVHELYLLTLAKLIAANALEGSALLSSDLELQSILDGRYFDAKGLTNLVEYDYFGWLTRPPHVAQLISVARDIQVTLKAYDFSYLKPQDLFGRLVAQMAERTQRVLLGQEPTPAWLVGLVVDAVDSRLPASQSRRYVDPCCGSGAFIVEVVARRAAAPDFSQLSREARGQALCGAITGFDLDPLAVMLAKVSWLISAKPALLPFNSSFPTSIPIYHADSLFSITPLTGSVSASTTGDFDLQLDGRTLTLPRFLTHPNMQAFFDEYAESLYALALDCAHGRAGAVTPGDVSALRTAAEASSGTSLTSTESATAEAFGLAFAGAMADLERSGRNGLWLYMLKNGYRPAMVRGRFNGVVTNFPWLALSKLANNPYKETLQTLTSRFNIQPPADCAPHLELATIFFLHAAEHYLDSEGAIAGVVPGSVIQGAHHAPLRSERFSLPPSGLSLRVQEAWSVEHDAFTTNVAAVLVGEKGAATRAAVTGGHASKAGLTTYPLFLSTLGTKNAWTRVQLAPGGCVHYNALQGADVMPRTVWFHELTPATGPGGSAAVAVSPILVGSSSRSYLVQIAHIAKTFRVTPRTLSDRWVFPVLTSAHVVQFHVNDPADALLPIEPRSGAQRQVSFAPLGHDRIAAAHFNEVFAELDSVWPDLAPFDSTRTFEKKLNYRNKLTAQQFRAGQTLVVYGASGTYPCAGAVVVTSGLADRLIIDQTIYWVEVQGADQLDYVLGMLNSDALASAIRPFQPLGKNGPRHLHKLPVEVLPEWDSTNPAHLAVVQQTRSLRTELAAAATAKPTLKTAVSTPTSKVDARRTLIRRNLSGLPSYATYQEACWWVLPATDR